MTRIIGTGQWEAIETSHEQDNGRLVDPRGEVLILTFFRNKAEAQVIADQRNMFMLTHKWTPTVANINALPERLRRYITDLQTRSDPAGEIATIHSQREQIEALMRNSPARVARRVLEYYRGDHTAACQRFRKQYPGECSCGFRGIMEDPAGKEP